MPIVFSIWTAARLLDIRSAARIVAAPMRVTATVLDRVQAILQHLLRRPLQLEIEGGEHAQAARRDARGPEALDELLADLLLEVQAEGLLHLEAVREDQRRLLRRC